MRLAGKPVLDVQSEDIQQLVVNEVPESRVLDYKMELTIDNKELLADITSFANTDGGVIVYGIEEKSEDGKNTGLPGNIVGLQDLNVDLTRQRLENLLRDSVDPRINSVAVKSVEVDGKIVLLVGIPRSLLAPHMVKRDSKFYARNDAGKFSMDTQQIRQVMVQSVDWENEADSFRRVRVMEYLSEKNKYLRDKEQAAFLHIVPLGRKNQFIDVRGYTNELVTKFKPYQYSGWDETFNLDGYLVWPGQVGESYTQFFRNGSIEVATSVVFRDPMNPEKVTLDGSQLEFFVVGYVQKYMSFSERLGIEPPFAVFLSVLGTECTIRGHHASRPGDPRVLPTAGVLGYSEILFPAVVFESASQDEAILSTRLRMIFDILWQAAGKERSPHYREDGSWGLTL